MHYGAEVVDTIMKPILYSSTATSFNNQGLGVLSDAVSCTVVEERNGEYELTLQYPVGGIHYSEIEDRAIIMAIPSPYRSAQPFRIYSIESPLNGIVTIHAHHISYDLSGIPVSPFTAGTCKAALSGLVTHSAVTNPFSADTDKLVTGTYTLKVPTSFRACLGGQEGSILDVYGKGEYEFDKFNIYLHLNRGSDNGVKFAYGVNITDFNMERNLESIVTGIYPYWANVDGDELVELDGKIIEIYDPNNPTYFLEAGGAYLTDSNGNYLTTQTPFSFHNVLPLDLSSEFEEAPTQDQLKERAEKYITDNGLGAPKVSIEVSFVHLGQTEEYSYLKEVEKCDLCDTVTVEFPLYGISVKAKIIAVETDVLLERYNSVQIGDPRSTIADTIAGLTLTSATKTEVQMGNQKAADVINNTKGTWEWIDNGDGTNGGATVYDADGNGLLRITAGGMGISQDGGLTYTNAITRDGVLASRLSVQQNGVVLLDADSESDTEVHLFMYHPSSEQKVFAVQAYKQDYNNVEWSGMNLYDPHTGTPWMQATAIYSPNSQTTNSDLKLINIDNDMADLDIQVWQSSNYGASGKIAFYSGTEDNGGVQIAREILGLHHQGDNCWMTFFDGTNRRTLRLYDITVGGTTYHVLGSIE